MIELETTTPTDVECDRCSQTAVGYIYGTEVLCAYCCLVKGFSDKKTLKAFAEKNDEAYRRFIMKRVTKI